MIKCEIILKESLKIIWSKESYSAFCEYKPVAPQEVLKNSLLFIGINPSRWKKEKIPFCNEDRCTPSFYPLSQKSGHRYFNKFPDIALRTGVQWTHFDLLYINKTKQNIVKTIITKPNGKEFIEEQLRLSKSILDLCAPKVIIVNNAMARDLMRDNLEMNFVFDEKIGTHRWNKIPVFFTSMLTGQRALDNGSYERLVWHIKQVLNPKP